MTLRNTRHDYGSVARCLHWSIAALFLLSYCSVYYRQWFTEEDTPENWVSLQMHLSVGITIAALVALRIIWRLMNKPPPLEPDTMLMRRAAHTGHFLLYVAMVIMPVTGYIGTGVDTEYFFLFDIPQFEGTQAHAWLTGALNVGAEEFEEFVDEIHETAGDPIIWLLILGHVTAALYHHYVKKDRTLRKMAGKRFAE